MERIQPGFIHMPASMACDGRRSWIENRYVLK